VDLPAAAASPICGGCRGSWWPTARAARCTGTGYLPAPGVAPAGGESVLLVPPLGAPHFAYDLRRGCSLVEHLVGLLTGAPEVRFATAPGGHLGVLTGRGARTSTWPAMDGFLADHS
jgi:hypothetical protein